MVTEPLMVMGKVPAVVFAAVVMLRTTFTGLAEVGFALCGEKIQDAPDGRPAQERLTVWLKGPEAVTWNLTGCEVLSGGTVMWFGAGALKAKSTTFKVKGAVAVS